MRRPLFTALAALALSGMTFGFAAPAARAAEPQILGLVASNGAMPMHCDDRECTVDLSAFCMQERAPVPPPRTPYEVAEGQTAAITIVARASGGAIRIPAASVAEFVSARGNRAVRMSVPRQSLAAFDLSDIAVEVGPLASLVPQTLAVNADPTVQSEIALVTGPLRQVADRLVDQGGPGTVAALITNRLINAIPRGGDGDVADRDRLWTTVVGDADVVWEDRAGLEMAEDAYRRCAGLPGGGFISFRQCLAARHDIFLSPQNRAYWDAVEGGS